MGIDLNSEVSKNTEIIASKMDNEIVMMSIEKGNYYGLNEVGAEIWEKLTEPMTVNALCHKLMDEFEVGEDQCQSEVLAYLGKLQDEGLIIVTG